MFKKAHCIALCLKIHIALQHASVASRSWIDLMEDVPYKTSFPPEQVKT